MSELIATSIDALLITGGGLLTICLGMWYRERQWGDRCQRVEDQRDEWKHRADVAEKRRLASETIQVVLEKVSKDARERQLELGRELLNAINDGLPFPSVVAVPDAAAEELGPFLYSVSFTINRTNVITALHRGSKWASTQVMPGHYYLFRDGFLLSAARNLGDNT